VWAATSLLIAGQPTTRLFRAADEFTTVKIFAPDRLELTTRDGPRVHSYSREGSSLRVVVTSLGKVQILNFKMLPIGLSAPDGTILYDETHFDAVARVPAEMIEGGESADSDLGGLLLAELTLPACGVPGVADRVSQARPGGCASYECFKAPRADSGSFLRFVLNSTALSGRVAVADDCEERAGRLRSGQPG
jgi:hypothetical protein